jgi:hypothetical protein
MPLGEYDVLRVASDSKPLRKLSVTAAVNCISRFRFRTVLDSTDLNPAWKPVPWLGEAVLKAPASVMNSGVYRLFGNDETNLLQQYSPELACLGVIEEWVPEPQYELDGFILGKKISFFHPLLQSWKGEAIVSYERHEPPQPGLREAVQTAVQAVGLDDCPFCAEVRWHKGGWKIIELNARLGKDPGLAELMADRNPLEVIEEAAAEELCKSWGSRQAS